MSLVYLIILIVSSLLLVKAGTWVIKYLTRIARTLQWSEFLVTFIFMAFATSLPELFVGLSSSFHKLPQLSFGNVIGANILNLTVGVAIVAILAGSLKFRSREIKTESIFAAFLSFLPLLLMLDGGVSRVDGIILLLALAFYMKKVFRQKKKFTRVFNNRFKGDIEGFKLFLKELGMFLGSIVILLVASEGVVRSANFFALEIHASLVSTGILFVSLGTVLPEIVFGVRAVSLGHKDMVLGNFIGTVVINSTLILAIVSLISPLNVVDFYPYVVGIFFTLLVAIVFSIFATTGRTITKKEALILIALYLIFALFQFLLS